MSIEGTFLPAGVISEITNIEEAELQQWVLQKEMRGHTSHDGEKTTFYVDVEAILVYLSDKTNGLSFIEVAHIRVALNEALREVQ